MTFKRPKYDDMMGQDAQGLTLLASFAACYGIEYIYVVVLGGNGAPSR